MLHRGPRLAIMSLFRLQRATWSLEIAKTPRSFAVSFSTAIPRRHKSKPRTLDSISSPNNPSLSGYRHFKDVFPRSTRQGQARTAFTSTKLYQEQQAGQRPNSSSSDAPTPEPKDDLTTGLSDKPPVVDEDPRKVDWTTSFQGLSSEAFSPEAKEVLLAPLAPEDIEIKPDGIIYLPEIKYRRILNNAFGPGAWGLAPRGETLVTASAVTREYALVVLGRLVSIARGEQAYFGPDGIPTAVEGCKSNAMMRCCKDLGIASELWDPTFIREFIKKNVKEVFVEHQVSKKRRKIFLRKDDSPKYPFKEVR